MSFNIVSSYVTDRAGNESKSFPLNIKFDRTQPPQATLRLSGDVDHATGAVSPGRDIALEGFVSNPDWGNVPKEDRPARLSVMKQDKTLAEIVPRGSRWSARLAPLPIGTHTLHLRSTDVAGNVSRSEEVDVKVLRRSQRISTLSLPVGSGAVLSSHSNSGVGESIAGIGDVNGDGISDFAISAYDDHDFHNAWMLYVVFGNRAGLPPRLVLHELDGRNGFRIDGENREHTGLRPTALGDVNGDGVDDFGFSSKGRGPDRPSAYIVYGRAAFPGSIATTELHGSVGMMLMAGEITAAGDMNGDGRSDVAVRIAGQAHPTTGHPVHLLYGPLPPRDDVVDIESYTGSRTVIATRNPATQGRQSMIGNFDFNGDGIGDLALLDEEKSGARKPAAAVVVLFGRSPRLPNVVEATEIGALRGFPVTGFDLPARYGNEPRLSAGDVNGDGRDDIAFTGCVDDKFGFVILGRPATSSRHIRVSELDGRSGFAVEVETAWDRYICGQKELAIGGDYDGDGLSDLLVGVPQSFYRNYKPGGVAYQLRGKRAGYAAVEHVNIVDQRRVRRLEGGIEDGFGSSLAGIGDINGDGVGDFAVAAPWIQPFGRRPHGGSAYVVYGRRW